MSEKTAADKARQVINPLKTMTEKSIDHSQHKRVSKNKEPNASYATEMSDQYAIEMTDLLQKQENKNYNQIIDANQSGLERLGAEGTN